MNIIPTRVIHEDSNYDKEKELIFIRLIYLYQLKDSLDNIVLKEDEHSEYKLINNLSELEGELISPFLEELFEVNI